MQLLKDRILQDGRIEGKDILKVDSFLNHQIDIGLFNEIGMEFKKRFSSESVNKILTVEASGIGIACITAQYFNVPVVFAKKTDSRNLSRDVYESEVHSFTKNRSYTIRVDKRYIRQDERVLIIDDFLANGCAVSGLKEIVDMAGAALIGAGIVIEKGFQEGGKLLREKGINVQSLAIIDSMDKGRIIFR